MLKEKIMRLNWIAASLAATALALGGGAAKADGGRDVVGPLIIGAAVGVVIGAIIIADDDDGRHDRRRGPVIYRQPPPRHGHGHWREWEHGRGDRYGREVAYRDDRHRQAPPQIIIVQRDDDRHRGRGHEARSRGRDYYGAGEGRRGRSRD